MGRGLSKRRRLKNYETAKQEKSGTVPLPPPPGELERKKRRRPDAEEPGVKGPASFRRMMAVKALAEAKQGPAARKPGRSQQQQEAADELPQPQGKRRKLPSATQPLSSLMGSPLLEGQPSVEERQKPAKQLPDKLPEEQQEGPFRKRGLKERKKEFLKKRKARKRGKGEDEDDLEERLLAGADKAAFGEQAMQPIKMNLKRKHWAGNDREKAKSRIQTVFQQQMAAAEARAAAREREAQKADLAQSFKQARRKQQGGNQKAAVATPSSLAALAKLGAEAAAQPGTLNK